MSESVMCDPHARLWCGRISLLCTVCAVLCTMIFQIWSYYFSLVEQMDAYVIDAPRIHAFVNVCDGSVQKIWNVKCNDNVCVYPRTDFETFTDLSKGFHVNQTNIEFDLNTCGTAWIWILPW